MDSVLNDLPRLLKRLLPGTRFYKTAEELLDSPILPQYVGRGEFLLSSVAVTGLTEPSDLKNQTVVRGKTGTHPAHSASFR